MLVGVAGLWHLGCVTAASLASAGHRVVAFDGAAKVVESLRNGEPPIFEPGLKELIAKGIDAGTLSFTADPSGLRDCEIVWIAYDTPVDEDDRADVEFVRREVIGLFPSLREGALVLISSQMPVGSTASLEREASTAGKAVTFGYSPENLRLGKAISVFTEPDRVVVGVRHESDRARVAELLAPLTSNIEWMSVESAEMAKHALNAFLAISVTFINEIATICERVGADAKEVERALKTDIRIGPRAYLGPGGAFAGGTLARDVTFLTAKGREKDLLLHLLPAIKSSNDHHRQWLERRLDQLMGGVSGKRVAVWGLTYKPGTDTLRRSSAVELCRSLAGRGAEVVAHDPAVKQLPAELLDVMTLAGTPLEAVDGAAAVVVATEWPEFRSVSVDAVVSRMTEPLVLDANRFLASTLGSDARVRYATVGRSL